MLTAISATPCGRRAGSRKRRRATAGPSRCVPISLQRHSNLGRVLNQQSDQAGALESCDQALRLDPALAEAQVNRAHALHGLGRIAEAEIAFRRALLLQPGNADTLHALGLLLADSDRFEEARSCQEQVLAGNPHHPAALVALGFLLRRAGDLPAAVALVVTPSGSRPALPKGGPGSATRYARSAGSRRQSPAIDAPWRSIRISRKRIAVSR